MIFYKRMIGDIQSKTGHLSLAEFGAYDRLLDHYYSTESGLPGDLERCYGIARALSIADRRAIQKVLLEFFKLDDAGVYRQKKADEMIAEARPKIEAARANGAKGGKHKAVQTPPKKEPSGLENKTQAEPSGQASQNQSQIYTVPKGTAADAAKLPSDLTKEELWSAGKSILAQQGLPPAQCGSFIGKLVKDYGGDVVVEAVRAAVVERPANAQEFLVGACRSRGKKPSHAGSLNLLPPNSPRIREIRADNPDEWPDWMRDDVEVSHAG